jgi:hypothetical protein
MSEVQIYSCPLDVLKHINEMGISEDVKSLLKDRDIKISELDFYEASAILEAASTFVLFGSLLENVMPVSPFTFHIEENEYDFTY